MLTIKESLQEYKTFKDEIKILGRRDRAFKTGWRHGITGVEDPEHSEPSLFYKQSVD
jgi:hypothetical protein